MFEEGNLLLFRPFIFKNGATPKDKFFLVLGKDIQGGLLLASLPTSKDHVPSDVEVKHGCLDIAERFVNVLILFQARKFSTPSMETVFRFQRTPSFMVPI